MTQFCDVCRSFWGNGETSDESDTRVCIVYCTVQYCHSPARGLCELHMGWGLLEPLIHSQHGAIVSMVESLIKSHVFFSYEDVYAY